jgi:predicted CXXCH cytochrome family protein
LAIIVAAGAVWLLVLAIPVLADNGPHTKLATGATSLGACASCHRAHTATYKNILRDPMPELCYICHGTGAGGSTLDVQNGVAFGATTDAHPSGGAGGTALRGGGFNYALINTSAYTGKLLTINATTPATTTSSHSVDGTPVMMWGAGAINPSADTGKANVELTCGSCHDPHGNGQYRILKTAPGDSYANDYVTGSTTVKNGPFVAITDAVTKTYTTNNYGISGLYAADVADGAALNGDGSAIQYDVTKQTFNGIYFESASRWCATCHTRYFAPTDSAITSSTDAVFKYRHATRNIVDPANSGAPATGTIRPDTAGTGVATGATLGALLDKDGNTTRGVAVIPNPAYTGPPATGANWALKSALTSHLSGSGGTLSSGAPKCITCHVAHGSNAAMSSTVTSQTFASVPSGTPLDSTLLRLNNRMVCGACHTK